MLNNVNWGKLQNAVSTAYWVSLKRTRGYSFYILANNLDLFCSWTEILSEPELKCNDLRSLGEDILRQLNIMNVAQPLPKSFVKVYNENSKQNVMKHLQFDK